MYTSTLRCVLYKGCYDSKPTYDRTITPQVSSESFGNDRMTPKVFIDYINSPRNTTDIGKNSFDDNILVYFPCNIFAAHILKSLIGAPQNCLREAEVLL